MKEGKNARKIHCRRADYFVLFLPNATVEVLVCVFVMVDILFK